MLLRAAPLVLSEFSGTRFVLIGGGPARTELEALAASLGITRNVVFTGVLTLRLFESEAPLATSNIITLVKSGYYDGKDFHRIVNDFVIQGGSPNGDGQGGSNLVSAVGRSKRFQGQTSWQMSQP